MQGDRLQKVLAAAGVASRRACETLITEGAVRVNGRVVTELGTRVVPHRDRIDVHGKRVVLQKPAYYIVHKPRGMVSTLSDPEGRPTLAEILKRFPERVFPVGRLDFNTSGALLCTNDGLLAESLLRPASGVPKVYVVKMSGHLEEGSLEALRKGVVLEDGYRTRPADVFVIREEGRTSWLQITLREGKNRQIHRMGVAIGHPVMRLARISIAGISTDGLRPGAARALRTDELNDLKKKFLNPWRKRKSEAKENAKTERSAFDVEFEDD